MNFLKKTKNNLAEKCNTRELCIENKWTFSKQLHERTRTKNRRRKNIATVWNRESTMDPLTKYWTMFQCYRTDWLTLQRVILVKWRHIHHYSSKQYTQNYKLKTIFSQCQKIVYASYLKILSFLWCFQMVLTAVRTWNEFWKLGFKW